MGLFNWNKKITFIDKKWNELLSNVEVEGIPRINELVYLGGDVDYYKVMQVINWPSKKSKIFIIIEPLSSVESDKMVKKE